MELLEVAIETGFSGESFSVRERERFRAKVFSGE